MRTYIVYRLDYRRGVSEPVGTVVERRNKERVRNHADLLKRAEGLFPPYPDDSHLIIVPE